MSEQKEEKISQATLIVQLFLDIADATVWSDQDGNGWATIPVGGHYENLRIGSRAFRKWIQLIFYRTYEKTPHAQAVQDGITTIVTVHGNPADRGYG